MGTKNSEWTDYFKLFLSTLDPEEAMKPTKYEAAFKAGWDAAKNPPIRLTVRPEQVAAEIEAAATNWEKDHEKSWGPNSKKADYKMVQVGKEDAQDLRSVASLVREGKFKEARQKAANLDTIVRDELPRSFYALTE